MTRARFTLALLIALASAAIARTADAEPPRPVTRTAVIVGSNSAAPGRKPLRYAEDDARAVASVLTELGGFAASDVALLLDPDPDAVLAALDGALAQARARDSLVLFYYSGHADDGALYPRGRPLSYAALRTRLTDPRAGLRLGVIDACRGGGFTGSKGLVEVAPFEVSLPAVVESEGSILIASSSGLEDAHESELLGGSFFTHHWNAALRGAGDRNQDGQVTLAEAFDYAKALTIRDSAMQAGAPQHPSFALNLRGRQDLALSRLSAASALLTLTQQEGPLELLHLGNGAVLLELPKGARTARIAVAPGAYLLRRRRGASVETRELTIAPGQVTRVDERTLIGQGVPALMLKRSAPRPLTRSTLPRGKQALIAWFGRDFTSRPGFKSVGTDFSPGLLFPRGLTDRWQWLIPTLAFTYRAGEHGGREWLPSAGVLSWGAGYSSLEGALLQLDPGATLELRQWLGLRTNLTVGVGASSHLRWHSDETIVQTANGPARTSPKLISPNGWNTALSLGVSHTLADTVTLHLSASVRRNLLVGGELVELGPRVREGALELAIGAVQTVGLRPQHLVQVHLTDHVALTVDAAVHYRLSDRRVRESYLAGASFVW